MRVWALALVAGAHLGGVAGFLLSYARDPYDGVTPELVPIEAIDLPLHNLSVDLILDDDYRLSYRPVELFKHGERYIVRDGRHRILWKLLRGHKSVMAKVIDS